MTRSRTNEPAYFISHASADKLLAYIFTELLTEITAGMAKGFVSTRHEDIEAGHDWFNEIHTALNKSKLTVVLLTPNSSRRQWVLYEYGYARCRAAVDKSGETKVVPILIGMDHSKLEGPFSSTQIRRLNNDFDFKLILKELASAFGSFLPPRKLNRLSRKFHPQIVKNTSHLTLPVDPDEFGISGIFPGTIKNDPSVLRSLASARRRIIIAGPSLSTPLADNKPPSLRDSIKCAVKNGVHVYIFLANPVMRFADTEDATISGIKQRFPKSNSEYALSELKAIYSEIYIARSPGDGKLNVILVNKASLDFAVTCDDSVVLCRSTIHWPSKETDQSKLGRHPEHDYKPPIVEAKPTKKLKDSFFSEYRNYLENLMYAADFPAATPDNPKLVKRLFKVLNISKALQA